jgi:hypothetical protein
MSKEFPAPLSLLEEGLGVRAKPYPQSGFVVFWILWTPPILAGY